MNANLVAICATVLGGALLFIVDWLKQGQARRTGAALEAATVTAATAAGEAAVAQAVVSAPSNVAGVIDVLNKGDF